MSPEFSSLREFRKNTLVPIEIKEAVESAIKGKSSKEKRTLLNFGFAFTGNGHGLSKFIVDVGNLSETQKKDAKKQTSSWNVVLGIHNSRKAEKSRAERAKRFREITLETASKTYGHRNHRKHRGKHRSQNKGPGIGAVLRKGLSLKSPHKR